jgi:hypothetical protein
MKNKRKRHAPEQIVKKLLDADVMLNTGKSRKEVLKVLEVSEATFARWRRQYGGMKSEEGKRSEQQREPRMFSRPGDCRGLHAVLLAVTRRDTGESELQTASNPEPAKCAPQPGPPAGTLADSPGRPTSSPMRELVLDQPSLRVDVDLHHLQRVVYSKKQAVLCIELVREPNVTENRVSLRYPLKPLKNPKIVAGWDLCS